MLETLENFLFHNPDATTKIFLTLGIVLVLFLIRRGFIHLINHRLDDQDQIYSYRKGSEYIFLIAAVIIIINIWVDIGGNNNMSTYLGLLSAGVAIALQDPLSNLVGWVFILARRPFEVGDRIELGGVAGDVIDIHLLKFSLLEIGNWVDADQSTGRVIHVPNRMVFNKPVANYTSGVSHIWNEIPIALTFESDWMLAKKLLQEVTERHSLRPSATEEAEIRKAAKRNNVRYPNLSPVVYTKVSPSGVILTLRYLCRPRKRRNTEEAIWEDVLILFAEKKEIDFAYPTQRVFYHPVEGKTLLTDHSEVAEPRSHLVTDLK
ncbi:MAG: mechanosensitive ion channel domain-containing protein [Chloroflexota bacterium]